MALSNKQIMLIVIVAVLLLVIVPAIMAGIFSFGVLNPSKINLNRCSISGELVCSDLLVSTEAISFSVTNGAHSFYVKLV